MLLRFGYLILSMFLLSPRAISTISKAADARVVSGLNRSSGAPQTSDKPVTNLDAASFDGYAGLSSKVGARAPTMTAQLAPASPSLTIIDGDTIVYNGTKVYLWGIDAPEKEQVCADGWPAGQIAFDYLTKLLHSGKVSCDIKKVTEGSYKTARCEVHGEDVSAAMARAGMAWAYFRQSKDYALQDNQAETELKGVHQHDCQRVWEGERPEGRAGVRN